jgi:hypothetical protein
MNRIFETTMLAALMLITRGADAQVAPPPGPAPGAIQIDGGKVQIHGDVALPDKPIAAEWIPSAAFEIHPDGRGNVSFYATAPLKTEKGAFLGLNATPAPAVLREQLKLKAGLVVAHVEPNSPADVAGLKPLDVVEKLDNQWLINPAQLAGLVRMQKPGDTVTLTILHKGDRQTLKAKLTEREMPVIDDAAQLGLPGGSMMGGPPESAIWMQRGPDGPQVRAVRTIRAGQDSSDGDAAYKDKALMLRIMRNDGHTVLTATDQRRQGKVIYEGPIDTPQEREKLPPEVRQKMEKLEKLRADVEAREREASERLDQERRASQQGQK